MSVKTNDIFCEEFRERYRKNGFSEKEIDQIQNDTVYFRKKLAQKSEVREITSISYERSQKKLNKKINDWLGI